MGIKTRYREKSPDEIPAASEKIESEPVKSNPAAPPNSDEATRRIQEQLAALQQSEAMQRLMAYASHQAAAHGYQPGAPDHQAATQQILQHIANNQRPPQPSPEPEPFRPQRSEPLPPEPDGSAKYSAPVSREASGNGSRRELNGTIRLSPLQREAAALAGISEVEYARQLAKLGTYKAVRGVETE